MEALLKILPAIIPEEKTGDAAIVHGDFKLDNVIFHPTECRIIAVLDWELSTLGHWTADLAYVCVNQYRILQARTGLSDTDLKKKGLLSENQFVETYLRSRKSRPELPAKHWHFYV